MYLDYRVGGLSFGQNRGNMSPNRVTFHVLFLPQLAFGNKASGLKPADMICVRRCPEC
jgi:hypothetical protein